MTALPTVEEYKRVIDDVGWNSIDESVAELVEKCADVAHRLQGRVAYFYTSAPIGYHYHPDEQQLGLFKTAEANFQDVAICRMAARKIAPVRTELLTEKEASEGGWVKVAYSPFLRRLGEYMQFFPGKMFGAVPNFPGPIQSSLASGLMGAGLGYGAGWLGEQFMPEDWKRGRLRKLLAVLGGAAGAVPGALWAYTNYARGKPFYSGESLNYPAADYLTARLPASSIAHPYHQRPSWEPQAPGWARTAARRAAEAADQPGVTPAQRGAIGKGIEWGQRGLDFLQGANRAVPGELGSQYKGATDRFAAKIAASQEAFIKEAFGDTFGSMSYPRRGTPSPLDINVNALGQTLWETGASPGTTGMTMGAVSAARQLPGGGDSGWVTPMQMANLAVSMGTGYLSGALVGSTLGALTGMPVGAQDKLKQTGMYLGIIKAVVPKLFGR